MFVLILVNCYTANLAAFLTIQKIGNGIQSAEDLVSQETVGFGTVRWGSTYKQLKVKSKYVTNSDSPLANVLTFRTPRFLLFNAWRS